jgi:hypothetical protein
MAPLLGVGLGPPAPASAGLSGAPPLPPPLLAGGALGLLAEREEWLVRIWGGACLMPGPPEILTLIRSRVRTLRGHPLTPPPSPRGRGLA